ncbi:MAG TPA: transketolase family protein [Bacteroidales bacterium]|jgi:transketolase|nr:transketolase family protein [Bacteroidales bacterium]HQF19468.1 transketolase family protein [Bacteroidales bacterium]
MNSFQLKGLKATRAGFGEGVVEAGRRNNDVVVIGADITSSVGLDGFAREFPDRFFSMGIAEQNGMGVAAGLALEGKIPVFSTYAVFSAFRAADQLRISVCYNNLHVIIGGAHAGISVGPDGATHQALEDLAYVRALPNITVLSPCDASQAFKATLSALLEIAGPVYIRFGRENVPDFTTYDLEFIPGKAQVFRPGKDVTIIATGHLVWPSIEASELLAKQGISARVINLHTIKPIDEETIIRAAAETGCILTAEEHQIHGGMGSAVAEVIVRDHAVPMEMIGINDTFGESGQPDELMKKFGLTAENIAQKTTQLLKRKKITNS